MDQLTKEEESIIEREQSGEITHKEAMDELMDLQRDYANAAQEEAERAAEEAYYNAMGEW